MSLALLLLHFGLACYALDTRSLWGDEAYSVWASKQPLSQLFGGIDTQPPFSYALMTLTSAAWGYSVFAVRLSSVCFGTLTVALMGQVGRQYLGQSGRLAVLAFVALSPILIYFDQEARMYTLACAQCAATMSLTARVALATGARHNTRRRRGWLAIMVVMDICALYTHFYTVAILAVNALMLAWAVLRRRLRGLEWLLTHGLIALGFGAWFFGVQLPVLGRTAGGNRNWLPTLVEAIRYMQEGVLGLMLGMRADRALWPVALGIFILLTIGLFGLYSSRNWRRRGALIVTYGVATLGVALATAALVPAFNPRYFLFALLPLALVFGAWWVVPISTRWRVVVRAVMGLAILVSAVYGNRILFDSTWAKSGYQAMLQTIRAKRQAHDGTLLINSDQYGLYDYYGPIGSGDDSESDTWLVNNDPQQATDAQFAQFVQGKHRVWVVNYGNASLQPARFELALRQRGVRVLSQGFGDAALALYQLGSPVGNAADLAADMTTLDVQFGETILLHQTRLHQPIVHPGEAVAIDLVWQAIGIPATDYTVFVHVRQVDAANQPQSANPLQFANDSAPANGAVPTSGWHAGQIVTDTHGVPIPTDAPPGLYRIMVGLYEYPSFERLSVTPQGTGSASTGGGQNEIDIGTVLIQP